MRILVWGINYAPELTGIAPYNTALCQFLQARGHRVRMVTTFAYYPAWRKALEDRGRLYRTDTLAGVAVHRCWHYVPRRPSVLKRVLHEASFVGGSLARVLTLPRPDVVVVVSPPLLLGAAAWLVSRCWRRPFLFHVQDLQPDAAVGLGMLQPSLVTRWLYRLEALAYRKASRVSGISEGMVSAFRRKGVPPDKCLYFPNGVRLPAATPPPAWGGFRLRQQLGADDFLAVYSGNLGVKQGLEVLVEAAARTRNPQLRVIVCGDGADRHRLAARVAALRLRNLTLLPLQPEARFQELLEDTDVSVITQQHGAGGAFFPSKLLASLAHGKPILAVADDASELTRALKAGGFGVQVSPGDPAGLAERLDELAGAPARLLGYGRAGRRFVRQFELEKVLADFERELLQLGPAPRPAPRDRRTGRALAPSIR